MTDNARHFTGVGLFCAGSLTYSIAFLRVARRDERADTTEHAWVRDVLEWCLLGATVVLVIAFVIGMYVYRQRSLEVAVGLSCAVSVFSAFVIQTVVKLVKKKQNLLL